jgi:hypothetical protein
VLKRSLIILAVVIVLLVLLTYPKVYVVRGAMNGGTIFWNANQALIWVSERSDGLHAGYIRYELDPFFTALGLVRQPSDQHCSKTVLIRITDTDVQTFDTDLYRYPEERYCDFTLQLFKGQFYAVAWPKFWKWSGNQFIRSTPQEYGAYATAAAAGELESQSSWKFDNVDGWSMRAFGQGLPEYDLTLGGRPLTILFSGASWPPKPEFIDLVRAGQAPQRVWALDAEPHRVSKSDYERIFGTR